MLQLHNVSGLPSECRASTPPLQVVVLVFEALGGLVAGQQGLALVARLTSSRTLAEEREAGIAELVASGKVTAGFAATSVIPHGCCSAVALHTEAFSDCQHGKLRLGLCANRRVQSRLCATGYVRS